MNNKIGGLGIISIGTSLIALETNKADRGIVGVSMINLGNTINGLGSSVAACANAVGNLGITIGSLGISSGNLETNKADAILYGTSIAKLDVDIDTLFQKKSDLIALSITMGTSSASLDSELNSVYAYLVNELGGKVSQGPFDTLSGVVGALDTAYTIFTAAQSAWNFAQGTNNTTQQTEIDTLQGQIDSANTRIDTHEEQMGISFPQTNSHFGPLEEFKSACLSTTFLYFDNEDIALGASVSNVNNYAGLLGTSINDNTNRIDNIIGVSLYNIATWKGLIIGNSEYLCEYK